MTTAKVFAFPARSRIDALEREADLARNAQREAVLADAIARGYTDGLARGRDEATAAARELLETSRREGTECGRVAGLAQMNTAAAALQSALAAFERERANLAAEMEAFCVDLALAMVARLMEPDKARAEFVRRSTQAALKALAPAAPTAVFLNPADLKCAGRAMSGLPLHEDETLAPGAARIEAGRLLVESSIEEAFGQIRTAVIEIKTKRTSPKPIPELAQVSDAV